MGVWGSNQWFVIDQVCSSRRQMLIVEVRHAVTPLLSKNRCSVFTEHLDAKPHRRSQSIVSQPSHSTRTMSRLPLVGVVCPPSMDVRPLASQNHGVEVD